MKVPICNWFAAAITLLGAVAAQSEEIKVLPPTVGVYHGTFPDMPDHPLRGEAGNKVRRFEQLVGKQAGIVSLGNHWFDGVIFPKAAVKEIHDAGKVPLVYALPWSSRQRHQGSDFLYSLNDIVEGRYDSDIRRYAQQVASLTGPVMISFGSEANGSWYPWSGVHNGAGISDGYGDPNFADGPELYRDAYRRFIKLFRRESVENVTWMFHVTSTNRPDTEWNQPSNYYPGDDYIDWLGTSIYSAQKPGDEWEELSSILSYVYPELTAFSQKPIAILEFGTIEDRFNTFRKADWITNALTTIKSGRYPNVKSISYWHERSWHSSDAFNVRVDSSIEALNSYRAMIADDVFVSEVLLSGTPEEEDQCVCGYKQFRRRRDACTVWWKNSGVVVEQRFFSSCSIEVCKQLMSPSTIRTCNGNISVAR